MDIECSAALLFLQYWCQLGLPLAYTIREFRVEREIFCTLCKCLDVCAAKFFKRLSEIGFYAIQAVERQNVKDSKLKLND
jgi:hypothetical protein